MVILQKKFHKLEKIEDSYFYKELADDLLVIREFFHSEII